MNQTTVPAQSARDLIMGNAVARAFAIIGDAWTQLILRESFYGVRRFSDWREQLGIPRSVLTDRLNRLTQAGLLEQRGTDGSAARLEYRLTPMGRDMFGITVMQGQWERKWASEQSQNHSFLAYYDRDTGKPLVPAIFDNDNSHTVDPRSIRWQVGHNLSRIAAPTSRRRRSQPTQTDRPIINRFAEIMGDYWSWAVLLAAFFRMRRFDEIHDALGVATNILTDRLNHLVSHDILRKSLYQASPPRFEYRLTEAGRDLFPLMLAMQGWSERWLCPDGVPLTLIDTRTDQPIRANVCDLNTGRPLDPRNVRCEVETPEPVATTLTCAV